MSDVRNFFEDAGAYDLPDNAVTTVEGESKSFEYYKHKRGVYMGFLGKLTAKFKDLNDKTCEATVAGAKFDHWSLALWIQKYHGTPSKPEETNIIKPNLEIPSGIKLAELYFPVYLTAEPGRQWSIHKMFEKIKHKDYPQFDVIKENPSNPLLKVVDYKALAAWYGTPIKWTLDYKEDSEKQSRYISSPIEIWNFNRIPGDALANFEKTVNAFVENERAERDKAKNNYTAPATPEVSMDELLGSESNDLEDYLTRTK